MTRSGVVGDFIDGLRGVGAGVVDEDVDVAEALLRDLASCSTTRFAVGHKNTPCARARGCGRFFQSWLARLAMMMSRRPLAVLRRPVPVLPPPATNATRPVRSKVFRGAAASTMQWEGAQGANCLLLIRPICLIGPMGSYGDRRLKHPHPFPSRPSAASAMAESRRRLPPVASECASAENPSVSTARRAIGTRARGR